MLFRLIVLISLLMPGIAKAECPLAEQAEKNGKYNIAYMQYIYCAEEENDVDAQFKLGTMFYQGLGLSKPDFRRAVAFFARAADNGYAPAQVKLGLLYWRGEGIEKNLLKAHKWLYLAQEPADVRWFYYTGPTSDSSADMLYTKIDNIVKSEDISAVPSFERATYTETSHGTARTNAFNWLPPGALKMKIPSYTEVSEFQHEQLLAAGKELLDKRSQRDLAIFLSNLKPDMKDFDLNLQNVPAPGGRKPASEEEKNKILMEMMEWIYPALLTSDNLVPSRVPVLEKLKNEIDGGAPEE